MAYGKGLRQLGDFLSREKAPFFNRTGATLLRGQIAMVDILATQAESTSIVPGASGSCWGNLTPCTQIGYDSGYPVVVCLADVDDNKKGLFLIQGHIEAGVLDADVSTSDAARGDPLGLLVSESAVYCQKFANGDRLLGWAMEAAAATSADTDRLIDASAHLRFTYWTGGIPMCNLDA